MDAAEIGIAGQHDMPRRDLAHGRPQQPLCAAALQRPRFRAFVHLHAALLGIGGQGQCEIERMDLEARRVVQPLEVALGDQQGANLVGRPGLERGAELLRQRARTLGEVGSLVGARHREPAPAHQDVGPRHLLQRGAHDLHSAL
jgi:hypothetical protein